MHTLQQVLDNIHPGSLTYDEWAWVGMAIKQEGGSAAQWDAWSARDPQRYKAGECERKWASFGGAAHPRTLGTLIQLAKAQGWEPDRDGGYSPGPIKTYDFNDILPAPDKDYRIVEYRAPSGSAPPPPDDWDPARQIIEYLSALFFPEETVGYVLASQTKPNNEGFAPKGSGIYTRSAGEIIEALNKHPGDLDMALCGVYDPAAGAWVRINSLDGKGISDANVVTYRHVLVEADDWSVDDQLALYTQLQLPVAALVHSGGKSLHAVVKLDATSRQEYEERADFLFTVLEKNGLEKKARRNRNASRLSRLPGIERAGQKQYLVATHTGKASWAEWKEWIEEVNDNLPDFENFAVLAANPPPLADALIDGVLRKGHKLLLAGPSKAGKSFLLLELALAVLEGSYWLNWRCAQGKVLYVNLELDPASCTHRLLSLDARLGGSQDARANLDIWNLRGLAAPLNVLAPKLIRRAVKRQYDLVIIDPIYKVLTGSENEADDMAAFCNQFDKICRELGAATVYCHHHSKGDQGQKASRDRASGSGVFARDPDAIIDLIELQVDDPLRKAYSNRTVSRAMTDWLENNVDNWRAMCSQDDMLVANRLWDAVKQVLSPGQQARLGTIREDAQEKTRRASAWRIEATLREFASPDPIRMWFEHPVHIIDEDELLLDAKAHGEDAPWRRPDKRQKQDKQTDHQTVHAALGNLTMLGSQQTCSISDLETATGLSKSALDRVLKRNKFCCEIADGQIMWRADLARMAKDANKPYNEFADDIGLKHFKEPKKKLSEWIKELGND